MRSKSQVRCHRAQNVRLYERQLAVERHLGSKLRNTFLYALASKFKKKCTRKEKGWFCLRPHLEQLHERHHVLILDQPTTHLAVGFAGRLGSSSRQKSAVDANRAGLLGGSNGGGPP